MNPTRLRERLKRGEVLVGLLNCYPCPAIIESIGSLPDFVWIDAQHGQHSYDSALATVRVADLMDKVSVLRVPGLEYGVIGPFIDTAPSALMVPMVNNAEEAAAVVDGARFPPLGRRSFGSRRAIDVLGRTYHQSQEPLLIAQIETPEAVENADAIAATEGVDALFLGADDLKIQMGLPVDTPPVENETLLAAFERVARTAKDNGKIAGCIAMQPGLFRRSVELGYQLIVGGIDRKLLYDASEEQIQSLHKVLKDCSKC